MGAIDKIYDNFEVLHGNYVDIPEARDARKSMYGYLESKGINMADAEGCIASVVSEYERQGFLYGFRYAVALLLDGGGIAE